MRRFRLLLLALAFVVGVSIPLYAALADNLSGFWELEEASGTRDDAHSTNDLTDNNTVTSATGKVGTAALFTAANSESLTVTDNASLSVGNDDFSMCVWFYRITGATAMSLIGKGSENNLPYNLDWNNATARARMRVSSGASFANLTGVESTGFGTLSTDTWYFVCGYHDATNNLIAIGVNDTFTTASYSSGSYDEGGDFALGAFPFYGNFTGGRLDQAGFWKRVLSAQEFTDLYNGGDGLSYAEIAPAAGCKKLLMLGFITC